MLTRILAAAVAGAAVLFFGSWIIYGLLLRSYFEADMTSAARAVMRTEPNFVPLIIAELVLGALFAFIFAYWGSIKTFIGGLRGGAILMFGLTLAFDLQVAAFFQNMHTETPYVRLIVDVIAATVIGALAGGAIGAVLGAMDKKGN